jgi:hypothetical protein
LIQITYVYWGDKFDEWIDLDREAHRVQPPGSRTCETVCVMTPPPSSPRCWAVDQSDGHFCVNQRVEVLDSRKQWLEAYVLEVHADRIRVHYKVTPLSLSLSTRSSCLPH